jgi:FkbM family methyltransferase
VPFLRDCLRESIKVNRSENVSILPVALGEDNRMVTFMMDTENPGSSSIQSKGRILILQTTIDQLVTEGKIARLDFIKMDIEGSERFALRGAKETISRFHPRLAICAYHLPDDFEVLSGIIREIEPRYRLTFGKRKIYGYFE